MDTIIKRLNCSKCDFLLEKDHQGNLVGIFESDCYQCYKCYFAQEDEIQAKKDDENMIQKGYVQLDNGKWRKLKRARK